MAAATGVAAATASAHCHPSPLLFVVCCPSLEAIPDAAERELLGCPLEFAEVRERCCGGLNDPLGATRFDLVLRWLGHLEVVNPREISLNDYYEVTDTLERFIRDLDVDSILAWRLLAVATACDAIERANQFKDGIVRANFAVAGNGVGNGTKIQGSFLREATIVSRFLARAMTRIESFLQFILARKAVEEFRTYASIDPEEARDVFAAPLEYYLAAVRNHDFLSFELIPLLEAQLQTSPVVSPIGPLVTLLVLCVGQRARQGFPTFWSLLRYRSSRLQVFVFGDEAGLHDWQVAVNELAAGPGARLLQHTTFNYVDFAAHPSFQRFRRRYPAGCVVTPGIGWALLARIVCHELLPADVERAIAIDLGDVLVLEDVRGLWDLFDDFQEEHLLAASHVMSLHHVNAGTVLYNVRRMRARNFTAIALRAARDGLRRSGDCIHDQSILNTIHLHRAEHNYPGPSPVMMLPCRWMFVPSTEWQLHWNSPEMWLPEIVARRRYPGLTSASNFEVYCPDVVDLLSAWAFNIVRENRRSRLRHLALEEGTAVVRHCTPSWSSAGHRQCCRCGERVSLVHVPGDMKRWPFVESLLRAHNPPWLDGTRHPEPGALLDGSLTRDYWAHEERTKAMGHHVHGEARAYLRMLGSFGQVCFDEEQDTGRRCCEFETGSALLTENTYQTVNLGLAALPLALKVRTTAASEAYLLIGLGPLEAIGLELGIHGGKRSIVTWVHHGHPLPLSLLDTAPLLAGRRIANDGRGTSFYIALLWDGRFELAWFVGADAEDDGHGASTVSSNAVPRKQVAVGIVLPEALTMALREGPVGVYAGTPPQAEANWRICCALDRVYRS